MILDLSMELKRKNKRVRSGDPACFHDVSGISERRRGVVPIYSAIVGQVPTATLGDRFTAHDYVRSLRF